jgi:hypothetical protein
MNSAGAKKSVGKILRDFDQVDNSRDDKLLKTFWFLPQGSNCRHQKGGSIEYFLQSQKEWRHVVFKDSH